MGRNQHLFTLETLLRMTHDVKKNGGRIVLTHGAFDLFHIGHLALLKKSAEQGDFLVVGVDSDKNIRDYKNSSGPIVPEKARLQIVQSLNFVDGTFLLDKEQLGGIEMYRNLYKEMHADVLTFGKYFFAKDAIYDRIRGLKNKRVVEIQHEFDEIESTSAIISRIKSRN